MAQSITMANAAYKKKWNRFTSSSFLTASDYELLPGSNYRNFYTNMEPGYKFSNCTMIKGEEQIDYTASSKLSMTMGVGYEHYNAIPQSGDLDQPVNPRRYIQGTYLGTKAYYNPTGLRAQFFSTTYNNTSAYYQVQYSPSSKVNITAGGRYDYNSRYGSSLNPRMGIVFQPVKQTTIKLLFGTAFRAPSPSDSYSHYGSFNTPDSGRTYHSYFLHLPNPGLKPVKSLNTELNISHRFSDNIAISLDAYYTALRDLYTVADDNLTTKLYNNIFNNISVDYIEVFVNRTKQENFGGSIELNWRHNIGAINFRTTASISYVNAILDGGVTDYNVVTKKMEADFISPWMARIGTDIKIGKFTCSPRLLLMGRQRVPGISDTSGSVIKRQTLPGYELLNISMAYQLSNSISFSLTGSNVLDQRYKNVGFNMDLNSPQTAFYRGQPQDPIRIMAGLHFSLK